MQHDAGSSKIEITDSAVVLFRVEQHKQDHRVRYFGPFSFVDADYAVPFGRREISLALSDWKSIPLCFASLCSTDIYTLCIYNTNKPWLKQTIISNR